MRHRSLWVILGLTLALSACDTSDTLGNTPAGNVPATGAAGANGSGTSGSNETPVATTNRAPLIEGTPQGSVTTGENFLFTPTAVDADGDNLVFHVSGKPDWATFDTSSGTLAGSPSASDIGIAGNVVISVTDGRATAALDTFSIQVIQTNAAPVITGQPHTAISSGAEYRFTPTVVNTDGDALVFSVQALPSWALFDTLTGELSGVPAKADAGVYDGIVITVSDGRLSDSIGPFSVDVTLTNTAPVISGTPLSAIAGGSEYAFTPDAADVESSQLVFSISNTPAWADFDTSAGILSGTPTNEHTGVYSGIVISVSDGIDTAQLAPFSIEVTYTNTAPVMSGTPAKWIQPGESYSFTPDTIDNDPDTTLTYAAQNLPDWASLNTTTGVISGTPEAAALHEGIVLSVSDGLTTDEKRFFIRVQDVQDLAQAYGTATEGSRYGSSVAQHAIDGDTSTTNHTACTADVNWWQVAMPAEIDIHRIEITSRASWSSRINGATVIVSGSDYDDLTGTEPVRATLIGTAAPQVFEYDPPLKGSHVAVKAADANCLHMADVKVYGRAPDAPLVSSQQHLWLPAPASIGDRVGQIAAQDLQGDPVNYALTGDNMPFEIDSHGNITVSGAIDHNAVQQFGFTVTASDSVNESESTVMVSLLNQPGVQLERWYDISGSLLTELTDSPDYLLAPDQSEVIEALDLPVDVVRNNLGSRLTAYLRPEVSGEYYFAVAGNNSAAFEISPSTDSSKAVRVASRSGSTGYQSWLNSTEIMPVRLEAGKAYFVRALQIDHNKGGHVSVGWRLAGQSTHSAVPADQLFVGAATTQTVKPSFGLHDPHYLLGQAATQGSVVATIDASDAQNDSLAWSIIEDVPFSIDQNGSVTVSGALLPDNVYSFTVSITDGTHTSNTAITVTTTVEDEVELAIVTGDAYVVSQVNLIEEEILATIEHARTLHNDALIQIYNLDPGGLPKADGSSLTSVTWDPTHDAAILGGSFGDNQTLLTTNSLSSNGETLAVLGESGARYIAMGGNPMRNHRRNSGSVNEQMHQLLENSLAWLSDRTDLKSQSFNVVIANVDDSYYFPDEQAVREWLDERFPATAGYNEAKTCDDSALGTCITASTDLLIVSQHTDVAGNEQAVADSVAMAMEQGVGVLYLHHDGNLKPLGEKLLPLFNTSYQRDNYWSRFSVTDADQSDHMNQLPVSMVPLQVMMQNFLDQNFPVDWAPCDGSDDWCQAGDSVSTQFLNGADFVRTTLRGFDSNKLNIFNEPESKRLYKLLALLGDYYRRDVVFPMDIGNTPTLEFFRAWYADYSQYQYRDRAGPWTNLGNFSRTDFSHITPATRTVNHTSRKHFLSTGAYALPGVPVTITRNDNSDVDVTVFVNTLRDGATKIYSEYGYNRPRTPRGASMPIAQGETFSFVSAIGGPIQLGYNTNDLPVEVVISNIGEHAYWRSTADNESFTAKLAADEFDWAEVAAPSFEVHSKSEKMRNSVNDPALLDDTGNTQALVDAIMRYVHNFPHVLAGFQGPGIEQVPEIHEFAANNGLTIHNLDIVKHMNADQATCGSGCSGNPYDAFWSFSPIGHGDIHEMGHGLEKARFRMTGWPTHTSTNYYSYYTKSQYYTTTGAEPGCQSLPFGSVYNVLKDSFAAADPKAYIKANLWDDNIAWSEGALQNMQMMMAAQDNGALENGWHLLARLHIIEREYQSAVKDDDKWAAKKDGLGMSLYERTAARYMSTEDWLLIAVSHATGFDYRAYFDVWGHTISAEASAQVAAMSLPSMPLNYYVSSANGYCKGEGFDGSKIPLNDSAPLWPMNDAPTSFSSVQATNHSPLTGNQHHLENEVSVDEAEQATGSY